MSTKSKFVLYLVLVYLICTPVHAYAYLDPGTGSYLFQLLIAGLLGGTFFFKSIVKKIRNVFKRDEDH